MVLKEENKREERPGAIILGKDASPNTLSQPATPINTAVKRRLLLSPGSQDGSSRGRKLSITELGSPKLRAAKVATRRRSTTISTPGLRKNSKYTAIRGQRLISEMLKNNDSSAGGKEKPSDEGVTDVMKK